MRNVVILTGRLTADPELRQTPAGKFVCSFNIAVQRDKSPEETDFIKVEAWNNTAQFCSKYFHKGQLVDIFGTLRSSKWEDANKSVHNERTVLIKEISFALQIIVSHRKASKRVILTIHLLHMKWKILLMSILTIFHTDSPKR